MASLWLNKEQKTSDDRMTRYSTIMELWKLSLASMFLDSLTVPRSVVQDSATTVDEA